MTNLNLTIEQQALASERLDNLYIAYPQNCYAIIASIVALGDDFDDKFFTQISKLTRAENLYICHKYGRALDQALSAILHTETNDYRCRTIAPMVAAVVHLFFEYGHAEYNYIKKACEYFYSGSNSGITKGEQILSQVRNYRANADSGTTRVFTLRKNFNLTTRMFIAAFDCYLMDADFPIGLIAEINEATGSIPNINL